MLPAQNFRFGDILEPAMWLVGALLLAALVLMILQRWRQRDERASGTIQEQLAQFRKLYERGEMSREEFEQVSGLLRGRTGGKPKPASREPSSPPAQSPPPEEKPGEGPNQPEPPH